MGIFGKKSLQEDPRETSAGTRKSTVYTSDRKVAPNKTTDKRHAPSSTTNKTPASPRKPTDRHSTHSTHHKSPDKRQAPNKAADTTKHDPLLVSNSDIDDEATVPHQRAPDTPRTATKKAGPVKTGTASNPSAPSPPTVDVRKNGRPIKTTSFARGDLRTPSGDDDAPRPFFPYENPSLPSNATDDSGFSLLRVGSTLRNPDAFVTSHLVQWKLDAEEGPALLRVLAVLGASGLVVTSILPVYLYEDMITIPSVVISVYVLILSTMIFILDGRAFCVRNPLSFRAKLRNLVTSNFNIFTLVWGRAILYMFVGGLQCSKVEFLALCSGGAMIAIGLLAFVVGANASNSLNNLKSSLTDDEFLWAEFNKFDKDKDGMLDPSDFAKFIWGLGLEFDDVYTLKAFTSIDTDRDRLISYVQFRQWWSQCTHFEDDVVVSTSMSQGSFTGKV